jgi:hypothetical protein
MPRYYPSQGLREPKAPFVTHTVEDRARWQCESKQRTVERIDDEHQSLPQHKHPTAPPGAAAQISLVERVQEPLEAHLANSILESACLIASIEPLPVETLHLSLSMARVADQRMRRLLSWPQLFRRPAGDLLESAVEPRYRLEADIQSDRASSPYYGRCFRL